MKGLQKKLMLNVLAATGVAIFASPACMASAAEIEIDPDVTANVWEENEEECASVTLNGKELLTYRGRTANGAASEKAEDLADKLDEILDDEKIDPAKLLPAREGDFACIKLDGATIARFEVPETIDSVKTAASSGSPMEQSYKLVNAIRTALGVGSLPQGFSRLSEVAGDPSVTRPASGTQTFSGHASWYGGKFHGRRTSDGSRFDQYGLTAAHRSLPFGTKLLVTNRRTGDSCVVEVNDRGPFVGDRVIDLSRGAAQQLNMVGSGVALVDCLVLGQQ